MNNAEYTFYPTVRDGYRPSSTFSKTSSSITDPGTTTVELELSATGPDGSTTKTPSVDLGIYGPGEVTNLDTDQVVRMEPEPETTAFPPNYFPLVEFDSPQLPWLFSPQRADDAGRNRPWLCLVVVETQATTFSPAGTGPLPVLETPTAELPDASETWAWAHAQAVGQHSANTEFASQSNRTVSRLLCPRNLDAQTKYRACVVPTFEPGRRAGLGLEPYPGDSGTVGLAWTDEDAIRLPVYHSWVFSSAAKGDFESLARELDPVEFGPDVGFRSIDVSNPGPTSLKLPYDAASDTGTVGIGGALKSIGAEADTYDESMRTELRDVLNTPSDVIDQTDYGAVGPPLYGQYHAGVPRLEHPDLDTEQFFYPHWFNTLNSDPRNRIAAGYGTEVVQDEQERLMASAWEQFGELDLANEYLRRVQLSESILSQRHETLESYSTGSLLGLSAPIHGTLLGDSGEETLHAASLKSDLPTPLSSPAFRRITRSSGPLARRTDASMDTSKLVTRLESGSVPQLTDGLSFTNERAIGDELEGETAEPSPAGGAGEFSGMGLLSADAPDGQQPEQSISPTSASPADPGGETGQAQKSGPANPDLQRVTSALDGLDAHLETADRVVSELTTAVRRDDSEAISEHTSPPTVRDHCENISDSAFDPLSRALAKVVTEPRPEALSESFERSGATEQLQTLHSAQRRLEGAIDSALASLDAGDPPRATTRHLERASDALDTLSRTGEGIRSSVTATPDPAMQAMQTMSMQTESMESASMVDGPAPETTGIDEDSLGQEPPLVGAPSPATRAVPDTTELRNTVMTELDPTVRLPDHAGTVVGIPNLREREDPVEEILGAPTFTDTTYELLAELDQEYFLPGVGDVPKNSIGVLQTNPEFIESFMTGLNHEFARELQWRNFPTDQAGTYFRRFWERKGNPDIDSSNLEELADIEPIHTWDENELGQNSPHDNHAKVVLLVRGELLRRYPNTDVFVAKAVGEQGEGEDADRVPALQNTHVTRDDAGEDVKFPVFRGKLDPDITFFGFDLSPDEALYEPYHEGTPEPDDHPDEGWFFVLQEPPAETRFGMDVGTDKDVSETPVGIDTDAPTTPEQVSSERVDGVEHGWSGLSWAHLVDDGASPSDATYVDVDGSRPGQDNWAVEAGHSPAQDGSETYGPDDAAEWGYNSAHMARATWQLPVRISVHADDMIPEEPPTEETDWRTVQIDTPATTFTMGGGQ